MSTESLKLQDLASALRAESGRALMEFMRDLVFRRLPNVESGGLVEVAVRIGLINLLDGGEVRLTDLGWKVGHALREYLYWEEQGRRMSRTEWAHSLSEEHFSGSDVIEIGSGFGRNLFSLQTVTRSIVGIEIEPLYNPLSEILADVAGVEPPRVITGRAEALPLSNESADIILSINSMPYMQIELALAEMCRVLRPGGRAIICTSTSPFAGAYLHTCNPMMSLQHPKQFLRDIKRLLRNIMVIMGSSLYPICGRLLLRECDPVCLPYKYMRKLINRSGLSLNDNETCTRDDKRELVYVAYKR